MEKAPGIKTMKDECGQAADFLAPLSLLGVKAHETDPPQSS